MADAPSLTIVHVLRAPMGGVLRHVRDLIGAQSAAGHRVGLICDVAGTDGYNEPVLKELTEGLSLGLHRVAMARSIGPGDIVTARNIVTLLKRFEPDVVHGHGAKGGVFARAAGAVANRSRRPARIYSPHGGSLHYDPASRSGRLYFAVERLLERACETIVFVADYERETYRAKIGEPRCATRVVYNGLTPSEFEPVPPAPDAADFLFIGEMRMLKGPDLFVDAIGALRADGHRTASGVMVGAGQDRDAIAGRIADAGLGDAISLCDPMPARQAFALARTVAMPSRAEAMPYIVLEALAAGKPLIASHVGGIPEIMGAGNRALIAPTLDGLTAAMRKDLAETDWLAAQMPHAADLRARFSAEAMAGAVLEAYREALTRVRGAPSPPAAQRSGRSSSVS